MQEKISKKTILFFVIIGIILRFYKIGLIPSDIEGDAAIFGINSLKLSRGITPYITDNYFWLYVPWHLVLWLIIKFFGTQATGMFITSNIISCATILYIYCFAKRFLGEIIGLITAFFALTSLWYIPYSRYAFGFITVIPFLYLGILDNLFLFDERNKIRYLIYAGLYTCTGFLNGYPHIITFLPVYVVYKIWREKNISWIFNWKYLFYAIFSIGSYLCMVILIAKLLNIDSVLRIPLMFKDFFVDYRAGKVGAGSFSEILSNLDIRIQYFFKEYFVKCEEHYNMCFSCLKVLGFPLISPLLSLFLIIGIIRCSRKKRHIDKLFLTWFFLPLVIYLLMVKDMCSRYLLGIFPAICFLGGEGIKGVFVWLNKRRYLGKENIVKIVIICIIGIFEITWLYSAYFISYANNNCYLHRHYGIREICEYIKQDVDNNDNILVLEDEVITPSLGLHYLTREKYATSLYFWDQFIDIYNKSENSLINKDIYFIFSNPDDEKIKIFERKSRLADFKLLFPNITPSKVINYSDNKPAKYVYVIKKYET